MIYENTTSIDKTGNTLHIALTSEEDRAKATKNSYKTFGEIRTCGFSDTQADRHTDTPIAILRTFTRPK